MCFAWLRSQRWAAQLFCLFFFWTCCASVKVKVRFSAVPLSTAHNVLLIKADSISFASSFYFFFFVVFNAISVYCCVSQQQRPTLLTLEIPPSNRAKKVLW